MCMKLVQNIVLVLLKSKQAKTKADVNGKRIGKNTEYCSSVRFEPSMDGLQLDALTNDSHSQFLTA